MDLPDRVYTSEQIASKGQHYIVHFSSRSPTDQLYTDAIDVDALRVQVDPPELIYGNSTGSWGWTKTDHCQFIAPEAIVSPIKDATADVTACLADMTDTQMSTVPGLLGINVVPAGNPDIVPDSISRDVEDVDPVCIAGCSSTAEDSNAKTAGFCRLATADPNIAICTPPARVFKVAWANPLLSGVGYDAATVPDAKPGDYIEFEWDDVTHDVWLVPEIAPDPCSTAGTQFEAEMSEIIAQSHHATIDPTTEDTFVEGRNRYQIPASAAGTTLVFVCSVNGHCDSGQKLSVAVGPTAAVPDPKLDKGLCPGLFTMCPDQSKQTDTTATVVTNVNAPLLDPIGADTLQLSGTVTRASTPWANGDFKFRRVVGKRCQARPQNTRISYRAPYAGGIDHTNARVWEFPDHELRDVVEACSSSHPETCTGISWKYGGDTNHTIADPASLVRTYSQQQRDASRLYQSPGWVSTQQVGAWMEIDLGEDREINGVVTQARGNNWAWAVTSFRVQYSSDGVTYDEVPGLLYGPTADYLANDHAADMNVLFKAFFPDVITARYVKFVVVTYTGMVVMRAEVLLHIGKDVYTGKHVFRRCLETDRFTRLVRAGSLTEDESRAFTTPANFTKSVACPGCYECREVPLKPNTGAGDSFKSYYSVYAPTHGNSISQFGFQTRIGNPGTVDAVLTVSLPEPVKYNDHRLSWEHHDPEFICRIDPISTGPGPLEPDLIDDAEWTTFLLPEPDDASTDDVINAIAAGFHPPEAVRDFQSTDQANLAAVYPPGEQLDPAVTEGPYHSREWLNISADASKFTVPTANVLDGERGGGYWPPKPTVAVTFMPVPKDEYYSRLYPNEHNSFEQVTELISRSKQLGWHVDSGEADADHTHGITGQVLTYGWRCATRMAWYDANWRELQTYTHTWADYYTAPPYAYGAARDVGKYFDAASGTVQERCPDGRVNAWEVTVPNGVYTVTVGLYSDYSNAGKDGCTLENVRAKGGTRNTYLYSVEVADGRFTLSAGPPSVCQAVNWLKLDMVSSQVYPKPWLPSPSKEWWQLELDDADAGVGMVEIRLPHQGFTLASTYPHAQELSFPDCRQWWLYAPAKCYRMFMAARKYGVHPELASYPNFPGFQKPFLAWMFDEHDLNGDGELLYQEFRLAQLQLACAGAVAGNPECDGVVELGLNKSTYVMWKRRSAVNVKGTHGYHDDNMAHLFRKLDAFNVDYAVDGAHTLRGDKKISKAEFVNGIASMPRDIFCDLFESTARTHGANYGTGWCSRKLDGPIPEHWGYFNDDGNHGFVVSVSNTPCTDQGGCSDATAGSSSDATVCEVRMHHTDNKPALVDCKGAAGKYVQLSLPGDGNRLLPVQVAITVHRAAIPNPDADADPAMALASTNPALKTVCYGVKPRKPPAADDPDLLSAAKLHPKTIVDDNPEDPIFWSTCYDRVIVKEWLPLDDNSDTDQATQLATSGVPFAFKNATQCLDCECVRQNYVHTNVEGKYDMAAMETPRWWLQPTGMCVDCNQEVFNITASNGGGGGECLAACGSSETVSRFRGYRIVPAG